MQNPVKNSIFDPQYVFSFPFCCPGRKFVLQVFDYQLKKFTE